MSVPKQLWQDSVPPVDKQQWLTSCWNLTLLLRRGRAVCYIWRYKGPTHPDLMGPVPKPIWRVKNSDDWYISTLDIKYIKTNNLFSDLLNIVQTLETKIWTEGRTFYCFTIFIKYATNNKVLQIRLKLRGALWNSDVKYFKSRLHEYSLYLQMMNSLLSLYLGRCVVNHTKAKHKKVNKDFQVTNQTN